MTSDVERYEFTNGWTMEREKPWPYYWILQDDTGVKIDRDQYRHDVIERHRLQVSTHLTP